MKQNIFITGGTGYIGKRLIKKLLAEKSYCIHTLVRKGSEGKVPKGCSIIFGDALNAETYKHLVPDNSIFIHLVGVHHPSPSKKEEFRKIDLVSVKEAVTAATYSGVRHFIYLSVSQFPSFVMHNYQQARRRGESIVKSSGIPCTFLRPWYVLGPGHWWPVIFQPIFFFAKMIKSLRRKIIHREYITIRQMIAALRVAVKNTPMYVMVMEIEDMKKL